MFIKFNKNWNRATISNLVKNNSYLEFGLHKDLKALCLLPYSEDEEFYNPDYEELVYVVPKDWLSENAKELFNVTNLDNWLQNEYTSDESEVLFSKALSERMVVMVEFN